MITDHVVSENLAFVCLGVCQQNTSALKMSDILGISLDVITDYVVGLTVGTGVKKSVPT